ncbi:MAG TPA: WD40 repeat domain-containing protein, partial [Candidatus Eremiobacteraceae bacterium]|nr:WD40 repeat domain-containing protein [Candidatus Eremiobacteraceae bacterium]
LRRSSFGLSKAVDDIADLSGKSVLLVVDQFEELFRYATSATRDSRGGALWRDEAANFVQLLLEATRSRSSSINVLITMRSDFIGDCAQFHGLPEAVSAAQFLVPSLTRDQREDVIRKPVEKAGATIDSTLVEMLLNDAGSETDQLPVLQHCLSRLWDRAQPDAGGIRHLGLDEYHAIGSIAGALSQHADEVMASLPGLELAVEQVFRALSEVDAEGRATRRALPYSRLLAETGVPEADLVRVLDRFRAEDCSFILPSPVAVPVLRGDTRVDVVHEALLRRWERISADRPHMLDGRVQTGWLNAEAADGRFYRALLALLETGSAAKAVTLPLDQVEARWEWWMSRPRTAAWAERYGGRLPSVEKLFQDSRAALAAEQRREEEAERREREQERREIEAGEAAKRERLEHQAEVDRMRVESAQRLTQRSRIAAGAMLIVAVLAIASAVFAFQEKKAADAGARAADARASAEAALATARKRMADLGTVAQVAAKHAQHEANVAQHEASVATTALTAAEQQRQNAIVQRNNANSERTIAQDQTMRALAARSQVFMQRGRQALVDGDGNSAALLLAAAYQGDSSNPVVQSLLRQALQKLQIRPTSIDAHSNGFITALAVDPHSQRMATASTDGSVKLWSVSGRQIQSFRDQNDVITDLAFDPSGRYLVSAGRDGTAKLHDLAGLSAGSDPPAIALLDAKDKLEGHVGRINSVVFSHNGARILTSGSDGMVKLWNAADGKMIAEWSGAPPGVAINDAAFSRDDQIIAACAADGSVTVWDLTGKQINSKTVTSKSPLMHLAISPDGRTVVAGALDGVIIAFDFNSIESHASNYHPPEWHYQHQAINALSFDATGKRVLSGSADGTVVLLDAASGKPQATIAPRPGAPAVLTASFDPASNGFEATYADGSLSLWTQEGDPLVMLHGPVAVEAQFVPDGHALVTGSDHGIVDLWPLPVTLSKLAFSHRAGVESIEFDHAGHMLTASQDGTAALWQAGEQPQLERVLPHSPGSAWVVAARFSRDGGRIVTIGGATAKIWDLQSAAPLATIHTTAQNKRFIQAEFVGSSDNVILAQTDMDPATHVYKTNGWTVWSSNGPREIAKQPGYQSDIRELVLTDDGKYTLSVSQDGYAFVYDTNGHSDNYQTWKDAAEAIALGNRFVLGEANGNLHILYPTGAGSRGVWSSNDSRVLTLALSADHKWLVSGGTGGSPGAIWDLTQQQHSHVSLGGGAGSIESASFSPGDGRFLTAIFSDGTVRLWDRESGNVLASASVPGAHATAAAFTPDGSAIVIGSDDGGMYVWRIRGGLPSPSDAAALALRETNHSDISDPLMTQAVLTLQQAAPRAN